MIKKLYLRNFKCFKELNIEFSNLNVFAGINSMGKSTAIQAILALRQSYEMNSIDKGIYLNGSLINLGTGKDVLCRNADEDYIGIGLEIDIDESYPFYRELEGYLGNNSYLFDYCYSYDSESDYLKNKNTQTNIIDESNLFGDNFSYVSADRNGPQMYYKYSHREVGELNRIGAKGEYYAGYLAERGFDDKVSNTKLLHSKSKNDQLIFQMQEWLSELSPGVTITPDKQMMDVGLVSMSFNRVDKPVNVGFGLSYVAPVILALLKAKENDLVILENPEAHLHPRGQRKLGEMIAKAASGGVQIIVETHSDHILNGIRLAVKNKDISNEDIRLNYFYCKEIKTSLGNELVHEKCCPDILEDGRLSDWPDGFFDEWDKALEELF